MGLIAMNMAFAYINFGRWVADCPTTCGGAWKLAPGQTTTHCTNCGNIAPVYWPHNADELWEVLLERPLPRTRNWYPGGHPLALASGSPHGQTPEELRQETIEHIMEEISPFWSENHDNGDPKRRDCPDCVADRPHMAHWQAVKDQDRGMEEL